VEEAVAWLHEAYDRFTFYVERDLTWTLQIRLRELVAGSGLDLQVFNDYLVLPRKPRALYADLALVGPMGRAELALELSYEPAHHRRDVPASSLPAVFWGEGIAADVDRAREFVQRGTALAAWSLFVDEGGYFRQRPPPPGSSWHDWGAGRWVLISRFLAGDPRMAAE